MKDCNQCGKCCLKYGAVDLATTKSEIELWEIFNPEIFKYVKDEKIWFDPKTKQALTRCPFLEITPDSEQNKVKKYSCSIYLNRPEDCRQYPSEITEMIRDECEMIELIDLNKPQRAQEKLNKLNER